MRISVVIVVDGGSRISHSSANHPELSISCAEFVPRCTVVSSELAVLSSNTSIPSAVTSVTSSTDIASPYNVGPVGAMVMYPAHSEMSVYGDSYLPQHIANLNIGQTHQARPPRLSNIRRRYQDACTQTIRVDVANACVGNSSALLTDASTNTPHDNDFDGIQGVLDGSQTDLTTSVDHQLTRNSISPVAVCDPLAQCMAVDPGLQNRIPSNTWADCWLEGRSLGTVDDDKKSGYLFTNAGKNYTSSTTNSTAARHESSSVCLEVSDIMPGSPSTYAHQNHSLCQCTFSNCPFRSPSLPSNVARSMALAEHHEPSHHVPPCSLFATSHQPEPEQDTMPVDFLL